MYKIYGLTALLGWYATLAGSIAVGVALNSDALGFKGWFGPATSGASVAALIFGILGQTALFPWICRQPGVRHLLPDIDGEWFGHTASNWPRIERRAAGQSTGEQEIATLVPLQEVPVEVQIKARLLYVTMQLVSEGRYSESETLSVRLRRDPESGSDQIVYVFKNKTRNPKPTDEQFHLGAGSLDIVKNNKRPELHGVYWTNRNWGNALNTAGTIVLRRKKPAAKAG
jgi:hypothetical protein